MKQKNAFVLLNGEKPKKLPNFDKYDLICATDGAFHFLKEKQILPHFISGDFDSISEIPEEINTIHTPNQDFTDFDKILEVLINKGISRVDVYGASGGEQDHFLGNLHTAILFKDQLELKFLDDHQTYFLAKKSEIIRVKKGSIVSLIPFPKATGIITKGLQYQLSNESLVFGKKIGTRNRATKNEVEIKFTFGELFIFIEKQE